MKKEEMAALNVQAREMKRNGNFDELRKLAQDNGINEKVVNAFIIGDILELKEIKVATTVPETKLPEVEVIVPFYKSIEEKLEQEAEELLKDVKNDREKTVIKAQLKPIIDYILSDDDLKAKAFQNWKELRRCYSTMTDKAKKYAISGVACISDEVVFGWIKDYYNLDDQEKVEKERLEKALAEKRAAEAKAKAKESKPRKPRKTKAEKEAEAKAKEEANTEVTEEVKSEGEEFVLDESMVSNEETVNASL